MNTATTLAFDRLAPDYDALTGGEIFQLLRARVHRVYARQFPRGSRVLEIGCGTGVDTHFLAAQGVRVVACDPSEEMVSRTLRRLARAGLDRATSVVPCGLEDLESYLEALGLPDTGLDRATSVVPCGLEDLESYLEALGLPDTFHGIVSNFGALNCVAHLSPLATVARRHLEPGGAVILGVMTRVCAFESLYFVATGRSQLARRRAGHGPVGVDVAGIEVPTYFHRVGDIRGALGPNLTLERIEGLGVIIPPPYLESRWQTLPKRARSLATTVDGWLAHCPPFNRVGDHVLLRFRKSVHA